MALPFAKLNSSKYQSYLETKKIQTQTQTRQKSIQYNQRNLLKQESEELQLLHQQMTGPISTLPIYFIVDILSRLPTKSLSQCRWVCKSWYHLIRHPRFTLTQHTKSLENPFVSLIHCSSMGDHYMLDHETLVKSPKTLNPIYRCKRNFHDIVGSCNGLLCLRSDPYFISNPITREIQTLPKSSKLSTTHFASGFCFDRTQNEYKVVRILINQQAQFEAEVYTLGSDCFWREIPKVAHIFVGNRIGVAQNVFVVGALHWAGWKSDAMVIVTLNASTEEFGDIKLPSTYDFMVEYHAYLGVLEECLAFLYGFDSEHDTHLWVMKEYGVHDSWMKKCVIRVEFMDSPLGMVYDFVKFAENDEIWLLFNNTKLGYYDTKKGTFEAILIRGINALSSYILPIAHVESLISPWDIARLKEC